MNVEKLKKLYENLPRKGDFSEKLGFDYSYIKKVVAGINSPSVKTIEKIAEYFNVPVSYFFDEEPQITDEKIKEIIKENEYLKQVNDIREKQVEQMQQTIDLLNKMLEK